MKTMCKDCKKREVLPEYPSSRQCEFCFRSSAYVRFGGNIRAELD